MDAHVRGEGAGMRKGRVAALGVARVGLLPGMDAHVRGEGAGLRKGRVAALGVARVFFRPCAPARACAGPMHA
eukprot:6630911-Alexandrium_andersonii.AAC.1